MSYSIADGVVCYCNDLAGGARQTRPVEKADVASFVVLNRTWAKDRKHVWAHGMAVRKARTAEFQALNTAFGRDDAAVFDSHGRALKDMDPRSFTVLDDGLGASAAGMVGDASYVRCDGKIFHYEMMDHRTMWLRGADAETFRALPWNYGCDDRRVYSGNLLVKGADSRTYRQITPFFSADAKSAFYLNRALAGSDPQTFEVFGADDWKTVDCDAAENRWEGQDFWARDGHQVYHQDKVVAGADAKTAAPVGDSLKDAKRVYLFLGEPAEVADVASFEAISDTYYRDTQHVYCKVLFKGLQVVPDADLETFEELPVGHASGGAAWDKNWIYRNGIQRMKPRKKGSA